MIKETKFNIGDKIVAIERRVEKIKCPICEGKPRIIHNSIIYQCEHCGGDGETYSKEKWVVIKPFKEVTRILIDVNNKGRNDIRYFDQMIYCIGKEDDCFIDEIEAQKECDLRNGK